MKKLFVSQPMTGLSDEEIYAARDTALAYAKRACNEELKLIDSFVPGVGDAGRPLYYLGLAIQALDGADIVCFAPGWEKSHGCVVENFCASVYGIERMYMEDAAN